MYSLGSVSFGDPKARPTCNEDICCLMNKAVIYVNWGTSQVPLLRRSIASVQRFVDADLFVISDCTLNLPKNVRVLPYQYDLDGFARKAEAMANAVPGGYETYLLLDADTVILGDISLGFEKARKFGIALSVAPTYSLDDYHRAPEILSAEGLDLRGQLLFNTGAVFFSNEMLKSALFEKWFKLSQLHQEIMRGDQEMLTIAMELLMVNPYVLSKSFNTRGRYEIVIGKTRIWHQRSPVPLGINDFEKPYPPRILARGRLITLRLKDTYGGTFRFLRMNFHKGKTLKALLGLTVELFRRRRIT